MFRISARMYSRVSFCTCVLSIIQFINFQMTTWLFRDALVELETRGHFDESVLQSAQGLCMGDIRFAEIQTTFKMRMVPFCMFLESVKNGSFNADNLPMDGYSHTTAILLAFIPDQCLSDIERVGIGNIIQRCRSPLGDIASIHVLIDQICMILAVKHKKDSSRCRAYMMLIGNYGGHMAFATDPPYCVAYAADYKNTDDPSKMTPCEPLKPCLHHASQEHGGEEAIVCAQLVANGKEIDCPSSLPWYPPVGVKSCLPRWAFHLLILICMVLGNPW